MMLAQHTAYSNAHVVKRYIKMEQRQRFFLKRASNHNNRFAVMPLYTLEIKPLSSVSIYKTTVTL